jgi:hypothetical protein
MGIREMELIGKRQALKASSEIYLPISFSFSRNVGEKARFNELRVQENLIYSQRSAVRGSTAVARLAGT